MKKKLNEIKNAWQLAWQHPKFKQHLGGSLIVLYLTFQINFYFLNIWQTRSGVIMNDMLLSLLTPHDFSLPIFLVIYGAVLATLLYLVNNPKGFVSALYGYSILTLFRTIAIYLLPLDPPPNMVFLNDPIARFFLFNGNVVTKDLFFSGHTSTIFYCLFVIEEKAYRQIGFVMAMVLGFMLLIQHVHYSIDVFAAPFFAYFCYKLVNTYFKWEE
jgi:hypothetical protein